MQPAVSRSRWSRVVIVLVGLILFISGAAVIFVDPSWPISPVGTGAALIAAGLTLMITTIARRRRERREEVVVDERISTIDEKSGYRAFQGTFAVEGLLFAIVSLAPVEPPLSMVLGGLFVFTALSYLVAYNYYRRVM